MEHLYKCRQSPVDEAWSADEDSVESPAVADLRRAKKTAQGKFSGRRKAKPKQLAIVTDACTGCAGSPVCQLYCPVQDCMPLLAADDAYPYGRVVVDVLKCVGCRKCVGRGPAGTLLDGCPWEAIVMVPTGEWEAMHGVLPY